MSEPLPKEWVFDPTLPPIDSGPAHKAYYLKHRPHLPEELVNRLDHYYEEVDKWETERHAILNNPDLTEEQRLQAELAGVYNLVRISPRWQCGSNCPFAEEEEAEFRRHFTVRI